MQVGAPPPLVLSRSLRARLAGCSGLLPAGACLACHTCCARLCAVLLHSYQWLPAQLFFSLVLSRAGACLVFLHFLPHFNTLPEPPAHTPDGLLLRRRAGLRAGRASAGSTRQHRAAQGVCIT